MNIVLGSSDRSLYTSFPLGSNNNTVFDKLCALLFAATPIVQHYYGLYENAGFTLYLIILPIMVLRLLTLKSKVNIKQIKPAVPLLLFEFYCLVVRVNSVGRILYSIFFIIFILLLFNGCLNIRLVVKYAAWFGISATVLLLIQYVSYYLFHHVINFEPHGWLLPENNRWVVNVVYQVNKLYRPSGFFLEPSHIFLYCFPIITFCLLLPEINSWRRNTATFLSVGVILSTSGMGIFVVIGLWVLYFITKGSASLSVKEQLNKILTSKNIIITLVFLGAVILAYFTIPVFRHSITRIFEDDQSLSAIAGRTRRASIYIRQISGKNMLFGTAGVNQTLDFSTSGFYATYIRWGLFGLLFSYTYYIQGLFKLRGAYFWFTVLLIILSFFTAHTHGTFYMMFFAAFLTTGYFTVASNPKISQLKTKGKL